MAKTYNNLFKDIINFDALYSAYLKARSGKRKGWACRHFEQNLEENLIDLQNNLVWGTYKTGPYHSFDVHEPKQRKITALTDFKDRVVHHAIMTVIEPLWESRFISDSYACRVNKGTHAGANRAQEMLKECLLKHGVIHCFKADISKYFASVDHAALKKLIRKRVADKMLLQVLDNIIDSYHEPHAHGKGIPIGNLTSQLFANIYLDHLDQWVKCRKRYKWYARYMDDFVIIHPCKKTLHLLRIELESFLEDELQLKTNHKTDVFPVCHKNGRGLDFLGYHLWPDRRRLRKASLKRFRKRLRYLKKQHDKQLITLDEIGQQIRSWGAHAKHANALPAIEHELSKVTFNRN